MKATGNLLIVDPGNKVVGQRFSDSMNRVT